MLITKEEVEHIENIACNQNNSLCFKFRQGRITASILKKAVCKVSGDLISNSLKLKIITKKIVNLKNQILNLKQKKGV